MSRAGSKTQGVGNFIRTLRRVLIISWRVSPKLYLVQVGMTVLQGLLPLASAYLVAQVLGGIAERVIHPGPVAPLLGLLAGLGALQFVISQTSYLSFYLDDL